MLSEVLKRCEAVLRHRDMYYSGELCAELQCAFEAISRSARRPSAAVYDGASFSQEGMAGFSRVIVLDARRAVSPAGFFDFNVFIEVIARAITEALGFDLDARSLHREQLSQFLKDERGILFCFFSLDHLTEGHYRQLRGLGFTQTDHRILFCGRSAFLRRRSTALAESLGSDLASSTDRSVQLESSDQTEESESESESEIAHLRVLTGRATHRLHMFGPRGTSIGRRGGDGDLTLDDVRMSRKHARIERSAAGWQLQDLGARNRGFVDGRGYGSLARVPLADGAVLRLGDTLMVFRASPPISDGRADSPVFPGVSPVAVAVRQRLDALATAVDTPLQLPPLRERREDILGWTERFFRQHNRDPGPQPWTVGALECLLLYPWNDNLPELRSVVGQAAENAVAFPCGSKHLPAEVRSHRDTLRATTPPTPVRATTPPTQAEIEDVLRETQGNMRTAAQRLNTDRRALYRMCEWFGIAYEQYRGDDQ